MTSTSRIAARLATVLGFDQVAVTATAFETESESYIITKGTGEGDFAYIADDVERFCEGREKADYSADFCQAVDPVEDVEVAWAALAEGVVLCRAGDCQAILRGARCEGGDTAEDYDRGEIIRIDGSGAEVKWDSQQTTRQALSVLRAESKHAFAEKITIDPSDPFAGLVTPEDQGEVLAGWIREKGAERLAVELLSEASGAGCGTWSDETRLALVSALEKHAEADYAARARMAEGI